MKNYITYRKLKAPVHRRKSWINRGFISNLFTGYQSTVTIVPLSSLPAPIAFDSSVSICIARANFSETLTTTSPRIAFLSGVSTLTQTISLSFTPSSSASAGVR